MHRGLNILFILSLLINSGISVAIAQPENFVPSPHVYRIKMAQCAHAPTERRQTGFRVNDDKLKGIVTALHGVVDCKSITAEPESEVDQTGSFVNLTIVMVDIERDVALLSSEQFSLIPTEGLVPATGNDSSTYQGVQVIGYPDNVNRQTSTKIEIAEIRQLVDLVSEEYTADLFRRKSPDLGMLALSIRGGHLAPGHSGAPILNGEDRLVGVGNGGLDSGRLEMGWAVPWEDIEWQEVTGLELELERLSSLNPQSLFSFSGTPTDIETFYNTPTVGKVSVSQGLLFPPATDDEILFVIADFNDESENNTYDIARRIEDAILRAMPRDNLSNFRIEHLERAFKRSEEGIVAQIVREYGVSTLIWGQYDDGGIFPRIETLDINNSTALSQTSSFLPTVNFSLRNLSNIVSIPLENLGNLSSPSDEVTAFLNFELPNAVAYISQFSLTQNFIKRKQYSEAIDLLTKLIETEETVKQRSTIPLAPDLHVLRGAVHMAAIEDTLSSLYSLNADLDYQSLFGEQNEDLKQKVMNHYHSAILDIEYVIEATPDIGLSEFVSEIQDTVEKQRDGNPREWIPEMHTNKFIATLTKIDFLLTGLRWGIGCDINEMLLTTHLYFSNTETTFYELLSLFTVAIAISKETAAISLDKETATSNDDNGKAIVTLGIVLLAVMAISGRQFETDTIGLIGVDAAILIAATQENLIAYLQHSPPVPLLAYLMLSSGQIVTPGSEESVTALSILSPIFNTAAIVWLQGRQGENASIDQNSLEVLKEFISINNEGYRSL